MTNYHPIGYALKRMKPRLAYTFGNHMHWVDMEWLWGYHVLPGSVRDMIRLCREAGVKGCVNFDGVGYEKLAAEDPEALLALREAVQEGLIEPVGCSYGQPYGLFQGGESNVRQLIYGARTCRRLLGVWPKTFWEEEFYFFPQLPQMLAGCGFNGASLYFQWTWHTPEVPREDTPVVWWEGVDGTRILAATRNRLNMHQWPEDMDEVLRGLEDEGSGLHPQPSTFDPLIQQWLELMPSPDWMCRSELILPKLKELLADERFDVTPVTLGEYLRSVASASSPMVYSGVSPEDIGIEKKQGAYLPHWRREGATYAVTFRLADSLPKEVQAEYAAERERLRELHDAGKLTSEALKFEYLRLRSEKIESFLDAGHGSCILREPKVGQVVFDALRHFDGSRYALAAAVVMPSHVHVVLQPLEGHDLGDILHSWKSFTAHQIGRGPIWQLESYDHLIRDRADLARQIRYVEENPLRSGLRKWPWLYVNESLSKHERDAHENHRRDGDATADASVPVRRYTMDQVWHGLTLGKNGDDMRHRSARAEQKIRLAETLSSIAGVFGRPYPQWDVYPVWELEEAWRELLMAQHHDNDECEGLCGRVGKRQYERAEGLAEDVCKNALRRIESEEAFAFTFNRHGWRVHGRDGNRSVRPYTFTRKAWHPGGLGLSLDVDEEMGKLTQGDRDYLLQATYDLKRGALTSLKRMGGPDVASEDKPLGRLFVGNKPVPLEYESAYDEDGQYVLVTYRLDRTNEFGNPSEAVIQVDRASPHHGIDISFNWNEGFGDLLADVTPGFTGALTFEIPLPWPDAEVYADTPYAIQHVGSGSSGVRKYPEGDWMTSPQWLEPVEGAFTSYAVVDIVDPVSGEGLLIAHKGNQQWFIREGALRCVLAAEDPWDADFFRKNQGSAWEGNVWLAGGEFRLHPHGPIDHAERWKIGQEFQQKWVPHGSAEFAFADIEPSNVVVTALYREAEDFAGKHVENYAGAGMGYPYVLRLVELNGEPADVELTIVGPVAKAYKTNLLGQIEVELRPTPQPPPRQSGEGKYGILHPPAPSPRHEDIRGNGEPEPLTPQPPLPASHRGEGEFRYDTLRFKMRPHEIATLYLDIVPGRKQVRDLDAKREVWATVHRREG